MINNDNNDNNNDNNDNNISAGSVFRVKGETSIASTWTKKCSGKSHLDRKCQKNSIEIMPNENEIIIYPPPVGSLLLCPEGVAL